MTVSSSLGDPRRLELPQGQLEYRVAKKARRKYCQQQALLASRVHLRRDVHMFPYSRRRTRALLRFFRLIWRRAAR